MAAFDDASLIGGLFLIGLTGGFAHCTLMCGPFVLSQVAARLERIPLAQMSEATRFCGAALLPYHLGRGVVYTALGALGGLLAGSIAAVDAFRWFPSALLVLGALFLLGRAAQGRLFVLRQKAGRQETGRQSPETALSFPLSRVRPGLHGGLLGLCLGFLPCGFLYAALAAAAATGSALEGGLGMAAFTLGTTLPLFFVALFGHITFEPWKDRLNRCTPWLFAVNAAILLIIAWRALP